MATDMEAHMKQKCAAEFLYVEKMAPTDIHQCLLNIYGDQMVDVNTVRWWCLSSGSKLPPLVQIFMSAACRLLFISGENT